MLKSDAVTVADDCFPEALLKPVEERVAAFPWKYGWKANKNAELIYPHWNHRILAAGPKNTEDVGLQLLATPGYEAISDMWEYIKHDLIETPCKLLRCYANAMTYGTDGIPHTDSTRRDEYTALLYVVPEWKREWAGGTAIWAADGEALDNVVLPARNRLVLFPGNRWHAAWGVARVCPVQRVTLMFKVGL